MYVAGNTNDNRITFSAVDVPLYRAAVTATWIHRAPDHNHSCRYTRFWANGTPLSRLEVRIDAHPFGDRRVALVNADIGIRFCEKT